MRDLEKWLNNNVHYFDGVMVGFDGFNVAKRCRELYGIPEDTTETIIKAIVHELEENNR